MTIINLTPHVINVVLSDGSIKNIEPSGSIARVSTTSQVGLPVDGIPIYRTSFGEIEGLPVSEPDTYYLVSRLVLEAAKLMRTDLLAPGELVRDDGGKVIGCKGLSS